MVFPLRCDELQRRRFVIASPRHGRNCAKAMRKTGTPTAPGLVALSAAATRWTNGKILDAIGIRHANGIEMAMRFRLKTGQSLEQDGGFRPGTSG